ncbi:MAG TPA: GNAT family N-acetyltransferase [Bacteroidota bacterium]|nr:GNAT family N-acetyltransferase [Bacteroidota bacterium]
MNKITLRKARKSDGKALLSLVNALADYEKLKRPTRRAQKRILTDTFGRRKRIEVFLVYAGNVPAGYAIFFETYSSFLALPTLYLEDLFVLPDYRKHKIGIALFKACVNEAERRGCGRMEWMVLDWNKIAIDFYERIGARHLKGWLPYRLVRKQFLRILKRK